MVRWVSLERRAVFLAIAFHALPGEVPPASIFKMTPKKLATGGFVVGKRFRHRSSSIAALTIVFLAAGCFITQAGEKSSEFIITETLSENWGQLQRMALTAEQQTDSLCRSARTSELA